MRVELRPIHAGELAFVSHQHAAAAAHAGAVDHDGVKAHQCTDVLLPRHVGHGLHHGYGADRQHQINAHTVLDKLAQLVSDEALVGVASIVGGDHEHVADRAHL